MGTTDEDRRTARPVALASAPPPLESSEETHLLGGHSDAVPDCRMCVGASDIDPGCCTIPLVWYGKLCNGYTYPDRRITSTHICPRHEREAIMRRAEQAAADAIAKNQPPIEAAHRILTDSASSQSNAPEWRMSGVNGNRGDPSALARHIAAVMTKADTEYTLQRYEMSVVRPAYRIGAIEVIAYAMSGADAEALHLVSNDDLSIEWEEAQDMWAGDTQVIDSLDLPLGVPTADAEMCGGRISAMTPVAIGEHVQAGCERCGVVIRCVTQSVQEGGYRDQLPIGTRVATCTRALARHSGDTKESRTT